MVAGDCAVRGVDRRDVCDCGQVLKDGAGRSLASSGMGSKRGPGTRPPSGSRAVFGKLARKRSIHFQVSLSDPLTVNECAVVGWRSDSGAAVV